MDRPARAHRAPPRGYWAGRTELRPWPVFLAQVLQFQCQLADLGVTLPGPAAPPAAWTQILLNAGFVTVPPAGYLAVDPGSGIALRQQCQALLGNGVDLRFCAVRRDQIAHELERAQHMNRISLIQGLRNQADREQVDILVPDGVLEDDTTARTDYGFAVDLSVGPDAGRRAGRGAGGGPEPAADAGRRPGQAGQRPHRPGGRGRVRAETVADMARLIVSLAGSRSAGSRCSAICTGCSSAPARARRCCCAPSPTRWPTRRSCSVPRVSTA